MLPRGSHHAKRLHKGNMVAATLLPISLKPIEKTSSSHRDHDKYGYAAPDPLDDSLGVLVVKKAHAEIL